MPAATRKPAQKATAAVRARREVRAEKNPVPPVEVTFRGETFTIPRDRLGSSRVFLRQKHMEQFGVTSDGLSAVLFEILGQRDSARFIDLCGPDDALLEVSNEFMAALNKAVNVPNSSAS
jgi:hypothetical protein